MTLALLWNLPTSSTGASDPGGGTAETTTVMSSVPTFA
jgi:hypothetical protein